MAITRSMTVPISVRKEKYLKELKTLMGVVKTRHRNVTVPRRREDLIRLFEFLSTAGFRVFGFSGSDGSFTKATLMKVDCMSVDLSEEIADGAVSKHVLMLDKKLLRLLETCKKTIIAHRTGVLMALNAHFPQDIVREIAENYV